MNLADRGVETRRVPTDDGKVDLDIERMIKSVGGNVTDE